MRPASETPRWSGAPAAQRTPSAEKKDRFSKRDLLAIVAGSVAIAGLGFAFVGSRSDDDGVALQRSTATASGVSGLSPVDGNWDGMSQRSQTASPAAEPTVAAVPLVARTEAEHIAQTQSFANVMMPRLGAGVVNGFTIRQGAMPPLFARAGVRAGDVVVAIDGRDLTSNAMVSTLSRDLAGAKRVEVVVERGGGRETLSATLPG